MAYDGATKSTVLFGGDNNAHEYLGDTWIWRTWLGSPQPPRRRRATALQWRTTEREPTLCFLEAKAALEHISTTPGLGMEPPGPSSPRPYRHPLALLALLCVARRGHELMLIRILPPEATVVQPNRLGDDVVAESPAPEGEPVLAIAGRYVFEFLDVVLAAAVIRVA